MITYLIMRIVLYLSDHLGNKITLLKRDTLLIIQGATWDNYWEIATEDTKVEYIGDKIYIHSPANLNHEEIFGYLLTEIRNFLTKNPQGRVLGSRFPVKLLDGKRVEPDLLFLSNKTISEGNLGNTVFEGKPTWIIEIISPTYRDHDLITKYEKYRELSVFEYWVIDPEVREIKKYLFKNQDTIFQETYSSGILNTEEETLDGFSINIDEIWKLIISD